MTEKEAMAAMAEKHEATNSVSEVDEKANDRETTSQASSEFDLLAYHEHNAGRLVIDPEYVSVVALSMLYTEVRRPGRRRSSLGRKSRPS